MLLLRRLGLCAVVGLLMLLSARPAGAQGEEPQVTLWPLACTLCETRVAPDGRVAAVFENRDIAGGEVTAPGQVAITLLDTTTGKTLGRLSGQSDFAADVAFAPDGRTLLSLHANGDLRLWEVKSRKLLWERFVGPGGGRVAFMPDGETIVASRTGIPNALWLIDSEAGTVGPILSWRFATLSEMMEAVGSAPGSFGYLLSAWAIAPDGSQIATATANDELWLFDLPGGEARRILTNTETPGQFSIRALGYTPDGAALFFGDNRTHSVRLWSLETLTETVAMETGGATAGAAGGKGAGRTSGQGAGQAGQAGGGAAEEAGASLPPFDLYGLALSPGGDRFAWVDQNEDAGERGQPQLVIAPVDDWANPTLRIDLPEQLRATPPVRVYWTPDGRVIAGGFVNFEGENGVVVVKP